MSNNGSGGHRATDHPCPGRVHHALPAGPDRDRAPARPVRGAARRPQARADRGDVELRPPRVRASDGAGVVEISYELLADRLVIEVTDEGEGFDPAEAEGSSEELSEGGLGIAIIRAIADEVEIGAAAGRQRLAAPLRESPEPKRASGCIARATVRRTSAPRPCCNSSTSATSRSPTTRRSRRAADGRDPAAGRAARRQARRPPVGDGVRRRRRGDQLHAHPADAGRRARGRVADHPRRRGVLQRHEDDPQRAPGKPARARARSSARSSAATRS